MQMLRLNLQMFCSAGNYVKAHKSRAKKDSTQNYFDRRKWSGGILPSSLKILSKLAEQIERFLGHLKEKSHIATRFDKLASRFLSFVYVASIFSWL